MTVELLCASAMEEEEAVVGLLDHPVLAVAADPDASLADVVLEVGARVLGAARIDPEAAAVMIVGDAVAAILVLIHASDLILVKDPILALALLLANDSENAQLLLAVRLKMTRLMIDGERPPMKH